MSATWLIPAWELQLRDPNAAEVCTLHHEYHFVSCLVRLAR